MVSSRRRTLRMKFKKTLGAMLVAALAWFSGGVKAGETARIFPHPDRIRYDRQCLTIDGRDVFIFSGAFHYFRCPKPLWAERFKKIKAAGCNCVETYVPWNWHEREMPAGLSDFSRVDLTDLEDFLKLAESFDFYVILRPGPYICAEWDTGGFPQWLMTQKPAQPLRPEIWLRTDDPVYLDWCRHWYDAVCPVIAKHQITRQPPGQPGVILVQIENEYDYVKPKLSEEIMRNQLRALAACARTNGIDVPLFTCVTHAVRGAEDPLLRQVFDANNFYPLWKVDETQGKIEQLRREQPDAPLATTELQGGWFAKIGGKLSEEQDGITAAQINNLTLFMIQNGETILNYYMIFGGTNPGDRAARNMISSYDYNAPIRESGGVGERYQRVSALGQLLRDHGGQLARSVAVPCDVTTSQTNVTVVERRALDGGRYLFVRTSQHAEPCTGTATVQEKTGGAPALVFAYQLEPFGSKVLYLPPGVREVAQGEWLPPAAPAIERPTDLPSGVTLTTARRHADPGPSVWTNLQPGEDLARAGIYDSRFIFYQAEISNSTATNLVVEYPHGDAVRASLNGRPVGRLSGAAGSSVYGVAPGAAPVRLLYENCGHDNGHVQMEDPRGIFSARLTDRGAVSGAGAEVRLAFGSPAGMEQQWWRPEFADTDWPTVTVGDAASATNTEALLMWYRLNFHLPATNPAVWVPWRLRLYAQGNGFLYLNGHALGRYWQAGPEHDFFLPDCWLNFGSNQTNNLTLSLRPVDHGAFIQSAVVEPDPAYAEKR